MAKVFITGSTDGLGLLTAQKLISMGNEVVLHARNQRRASDVHKKLPGAKVLIGDLGNQNEVEVLAKQMNGIERFDTIIHNAGIAVDDPQLIFRVNVIAPYLLTALARQPKRLVYVSSGMHRGSTFDVNHLAQTTDYSASKLQVLMLAKAIARLWPTVATNAVDPGWVPTKMGGRGASDNLEQGYAGQVWLATTADSSLTGQYLYHSQPSRYDQRADNVELQTQLLKQLKEITGISLA
ncbi:daunorubicin C-13 ketoreductase [Lactobacillus sp. CBA3606]|uniref:SDR family NAD(P)-dependent oxidoreductase n=1 Tax=Lactobacillus sp. CBA3606 TaxID=2099789 RepID=UPI000CFA81E2|nr:SDR family NAD(P)-dependent oxidoreductase [Lactobacillus sp. CBA3606]AVK64568.1 daunorubicin C-13 ketoreductase [Lactobacillus sp. CBA3606]